MTDTFVPPIVTRRASRHNGVFAAQQKSFSLAPLGGMTAQSDAETIYSAWVQMPAEQSVLDLDLAITALTGTSPTLEIAVQTCRQVVNGNAVDTPRVAPGGAFPPQSAVGSVSTQCLVLQWARLQIIVGGTTPACAFTVGGTGVPLGLV